jgi:hypothetical protein
VKKLCIGPFVIATFELSALIGGQTNESGNVINNFAEAHGHVATGSPPRATGTGKLAHAFRHAGSEVGLHCYVVYRVLCSIYSGCLPGL